MSEATLIPEAELAETLGLSREILIAARRAVLSDGDFQRKKNAVAYPPAAVEKLRAHLALPAVALPAGEPPLVTLTISRRARQNGKIVFAVKKEGGGEIAVRVRDASALVPGQEIRVRLEGSARASLFGPQPRYRAGIRLPDRP